MKIYHTYETYMKDPIFLSKESFLFGPVCVTGTPLYHASSVSAYSFLCRVTCITLLFPFPSIINHEL